jgi:hypothetical protein
MLANQVNNALQRFVLDVSVSLECSASIDMTTHSTYQVWLTYLEIRIADECTSCKVR